MRTFTKTSLVLPMLIASLGVMLAGGVTAQTFTTLHGFTTTSGSLAANSDGATPYAGLVLSGNFLYGTVSDGGSSGNGTVFMVNTDGTGFTNLHSFTALTSPQRNIDGANPRSGLILSGTSLYGTAFYGGSSGNGTVFKVNTDGSDFTNLHSFTELTGTEPAPQYETNIDGANPRSGLIFSGNTLYGTAFSGGSGGAGTVFAVNTDGSGFTNLYSFTSTSTNNDGAAPWAGLILSGNTLYGAALFGGRSDNGTIFSLSFTPQLTITPSASSIVLTWPTNYTGFDYTRYTLQSTTNLGSSAVWTTNLPSPVVVNGQNVVTNPMTGTRQFFRLSQ